VNKKWTITWLQQKLYAIHNHTGHRATDVAMSAHGPMVTGMFGEVDWRQTFDEIGTTDIVERVFGRAWGAEAPYIRIQWTGADGRRHSEDVEIPFAA